MNDRTAQLSHLFELHRVDLLENNNMATRHYLMATVARASSLVSQCSIRTSMSDFFEWRTQYLILSEIFRSLQKDFAEKDTAKNYDATLRVIDDCLAALKQRIDPAK